MPSDMLQNPHGRQRDVVLRAPTHRGKDFAEARHVVHNVAATQSLAFVYAAFTLGVWAVSVNP